MHVTADFSMYLMKRKKYPILYGDGKFIINRQMRD